MLYSDVLRIGLNHTTSSNCDNITKVVKKSDANRLKACIWNAQSLRQKSQTVKDFTDEYGLDIFLFTETWLKSDDKVEIGDLERNGEYFYLGSHRENRTGGGVGCIIKQGIEATKKETVKTKTFEHMEIEVKLKGKFVTFLVIYRPEPSKKNNYSLDEFFKEFTKFISRHQTSNNETIITGDFNFHFNKPNNAKATRFKGILEMFDLIQHVSKATHKDGNTLDLVITNRTTALRDCVVSELLSDHNCICFNIEANKGKNPQKKISFRKTRDINITEFKKEIKQHLSQHLQHHSRSIQLNKLVEIYNSTQEVFDKHAPEITKLVTLRKPTPFTNADIKHLKRAKRKAERLWRRTGLERHWNDFKEKRNTFNDHLNQLKSDDF